MQLIKLDATDSTNSYLKNLLLTDRLEDFTVVQAGTQWKGRGQMGTEWLSEPGMNLTFSFLKKHTALPVREQFSITMATSLGVFNALKNFQIPDLRVKWPNDILSGTSKICGILIENITAGGYIQSSVVGIGLNVNQRDFGSLPQVSSLRLLLGHPLDTDELLHELIDHLVKAFEQAERQSPEASRAAYEALLFRKDKAATFRDREGRLFMGFIRGVSPAGKLVIALEDEVLREYELKEVQLMY